MNQSRFTLISIITTISIVILLAVQISWMTSIFEEVELQTKQRLEQAMIGSMYQISSASDNPIYNPLDLKFDESESFVELSFASAFSIFSAASSEADSVVGNPAPFALVLLRSVSHIDSLISYNLTIAGITQPFHLHLEYMDHISGDTLFMYNNEVDIKTYSKLQQAITLNFSLERIMKLNFNDGNPMYLTVTSNVKYGQYLYGIIISTILVMLIVIFSFVFIVRTLFRYKTVEEMRTDFTHNITHELKTPISVGRAAGEALLAYEVLMDNPESRKEYIQIMLEQYSNLSSMVNNILETSVLKNDDYKITPSDCNLTHIITDIIEIHKLKSTKPISFKIDIPTGLTIYADKFHLPHILGNLIDNAMKYSGSNVDITISAKVSSKDITLCVSDNGIGIPARSIKHIFQKYYRVPTGDVHDTNGQGIGLYYIKMIVEKHGGAIAAKSTVGKGTSIIINFPRQ